MDISAPRLAASLGAKRELWHWGQAFCPSVPQKNRLCWRELWVGAGAKNYNSNRLRVEKPRPKFHKLTKKVVHTVNGRIRIQVGLKQSVRGGVEY